MNNGYKTRKGTYRETVKQVTEIVDIHFPKIKKEEEYATTHTVEYKTKDKVDVFGVNGSLEVDISRGNFDFWNRLKQAYNMVLGKNIKISGGAPDKSAIENHPVVQQYLADSEGFNRVLQERREQIKTEVLSDKQFEVTAKGVKEIPLEERLPE